MVFLYSTITMTSIIFIFAEVLPKIYAIRKAEKLLIFYTPYLNISIDDFISYKQRHTYNYSIPSKK